MPFARLLNMNQALSNMKIEDCVQWIRLFVIAIFMFLPVTESSASKPNICESKYKGGGRVDHAALKEILSDHFAWVKAGDLNENDKRRANLCEANLNGANLSKAMLAGANLSGTKLEKADLSEAVLIEANLSGAWLHEANLREAKLFEADLSESMLAGANLRGAELNKANLKDSHLREADLRKAILSSTDLRGSNLYEADLSGADLSNANMAGITLYNANLHEAILTETNLKNADLKEADLHGAKLVGANLSGADLSKANLKEADLYGADLHGANLQEVNLVKANLSNVDLSNAKLVGANIDGADLSNANLSGADLSKANLSWANLRQAELIKTKLINTNLSNSKFTNVNLERATYEPITTPDKAFLGGILNLDKVRFDVEKQSGLVSLRNSLKASGLRELERKATYAIEKGKTDHTSSMLDKYGRRLFFEYTAGYGLYPWQCLIILLSFIPAFSLIYFFPVYRKQEHSESLGGGIYRIWIDDRIRQDLGSAEPELISAGFIKSIGYAFYFSLLSAFHIGWRDINVGNWIARLQPREYSLQSTGWVRTVSGIQSLISVYLLAFWVLTQFGRPFD